MFFVAPSQPYNPNSGVKHYDLIPAPQKQNYIDNCKGLNLASLKCTTNSQLSSNYNNVYSIAQNSHSYDNIDGSIPKHHSFHSNDPKGLVIDVRQDPSNIVNTVPQNDPHHVSHPDQSINSYLNINSNGIGSVNTIDSSNNGIGRLIPKFNAYNTNHGLVFDVRDKDKGNPVYSSSLNNKVNPFSRSVSKYEKVLDSFSIDDSIDISSDIDTPISLSLVKFDAESTYSYSKKEGIIEDHVNNPLKDHVENSLSKSQSQHSSNDQDKINSKDEIDHTKVEIVVHASHNNQTLDLEEDKYLPNADAIIILNTIPKTNLSSNDGSGTYRLPTILLLLLCL